MGTKRGGVCIYYKEDIYLICKPNLTPLDQCPSQSLEDFEIFKNGWENTILNINNSNQYLTIFIGNFNARNTF